MNRLYTYKITTDYLRVEAISVSLYSRDVSGFTGHEHLYAFNLININGRNGVYPEWPCYFGNPMVSRMLSPDKYIQAPDFSQSFNRYSYAWNNPLVFTDPDGEIVFTLATHIAAPFTGGTSLALLPIAIGADIGLWQGGSLANGTMNPFYSDFVLLQLDNEIQNKLRAAKYKISFKAIHKQALSLHQFSKSWYIHLILWTISILFIYKHLLQ
ncbi:MAG: hypothetical protein M0Q41_12475 [Bacteroidales bacterium]|nr:hypothetical protein [Bacteroidales bacterium]